MQRHEEFVGLLVTHQQSLYSYIRTLDDLIGNHNSANVYTDGNVSGQFEAMLAA